MGFPSKLKQLDCFIDGQGHLGTVEEVELPKIALKTDDWRGGGMLGPVDIDMGLDKIEMGVTMGGLIEAAIRSFGASATDAALVRFAGAYQDDQTGAVRAVEVAVLGRLKEIDWGNAKTGDNTSHKYKYGCSYFRLTVDGVEWMEIDMINMIFRVFGADRYAEIRAAIGG
ncbi:phage major tail tube protein [Novosphingobium huizhouense]|uniref:phage major tail tube protein n=1 Tax=Novosphingobium huizhouense TaxID=2866625 RepID=UPI001CD8C3D8|nr:phage major tail tube protein [Novosphingobium huizhouense]